MNATNYVKKQLADKKKNNPQKYKEVGKQKSKPISYKK